MENPPSRTLKDRFWALIRLNNSPHEIALGVAIGAFIAITPLYGFHTLLVILAAVSIRRVNKIAILLGTNVSTTPTFPFITWAGYSIGRWMLGAAYPPIHWAMFRHMDMNGLMKFYVPLFLGSLVLGFFAAVVLYGLTRWFVTARRGRQEGGPL
jgi:uncharacterized protein (TIGR03546 family)